MGPRPRVRRTVAFFCFAALTVGATPLAACDPVWLPMARPDGISVFVAVALAETVLDTALATTQRWLHPRFAARLDTITAHTPGGQRVRLLNPMSEAILVPWAYGPDCRPIAWSGRLDWIPEGTRGAVAGWLRAREGWIEGRPTFDVEMAWREPVWVENDPRWPEAAGGGPHLDPDEFVQLYSALPTLELLQREPGEAARRLRQWEQEHPALAVRAPAHAMLSYVYRFAEEPRRGTTR